MLPIACHLLCANTSFRLRLPSCQRPRATNSFLTSQPRVAAGICCTNASKQRIRVVPCDRTVHDIEKRHQLHTVYNCRYPVHPVMNPFGNQPEPLPPLRNDRGIVSCGQIGLQAIFCKIERPGEEVLLAFITNWNNYDILVFTMLLRTHPDLRRTGRCSVGVVCRSYFR